MMLKIICVIYIIYINVAPFECDETAIILSEIPNLSGVAKAPNPFKRPQLQVHFRAEPERQGTWLDESILRLHQYIQSVGKYISSCPAGISGISNVSVPMYDTQPFHVVCDTNEFGTGWTIILRRLDGSVDFYRNWTEYQNGFGSLRGEFFLGLDKIHALTAEYRQELLVLLEDFNGERRYENYDNFAIGDELESYALHTLGFANGNAGDSLRTHYGCKFSTFDNDNGLAARDCATAFTGAWWYNNCHHSHLTGVYNDTTHSKGINWFTFRDPYYSLKTASMMIRPKY